MLSQYPLKHHILNTGLPRSAVHAQANSKHVRVCESQRVASQASSWPEARTAQHKRRRARLHSAATTRSAATTQYGSQSFSSLWPGCSLRWGLDTPFGTRVCGCCIPFVAGTTSRFHQVEHLQGRCLYSEKFGHSAAEYAFPKQDVFSPYAVVYRFTYHPHSRHQAPLAALWCAHN